MNYKLLILVLGTFLVVGCGNGAAEDQKTAENTESSKITKIADIEQGIRNHIASETDGSGTFHLEDDEHNLDLRLVRVHTEYLSNLGPGRHFACVDLADEKGDVYDVDFFLEGKPGDMDVTETTIHKLNGKPYYTWKQQEDKTWKRVPVESASNELLGVVEGEDEFEFRYEVLLPEISEDARMWIPVATSDQFQTIEIKSLGAPVEYEMLEEKKFGNKILFVELSPEHSGDKLEVVYQVERKERGPHEDLQTNPQDYLGSSALIPVGGRFEEIVDEALEEKQSDSDLMKARALYDYIIDNMQYRKAGEYGTGDANYACDSKSGNCTEFHSFFISLARTAGIPARFSIGAAIPSERNEGGVNGYHCWAEFYADGKWWPVDISEGNKYTALATYYFGHHPANRIELSRGRDLEVEPSPISGPIKFHAYPILEVGGKLTPTDVNFSFQREPKPTS